MPDEQDSHQSCLKQTNATPKPPKAVKWSEEMQITTDAETAYFAATQGFHLMLTEEPKPVIPIPAVPMPADAVQAEREQPDSVPADDAFPAVREQPDSVSADDAFPAPIEPPSEAGLPDDSEGEQHNQSHLSGSEGEGKAEESLLTPDVQVDGVVSAKAPETCPSAEEVHPGEEQPRRSRRRRQSPSSEEEHPGEEHSGEDQPRRSRRRRRERICYPSKQERRSRKQKSQAK